MGLDTLAAPIMFRGTSFLSLDSERSWFFRRTPAAVVTYPSCGSNQNQLIAIYRDHGGYFTRLRDFFDLFPRCAQII